MYKILNQKSWIKQELDSIQMAIISKNPTLIKYYQHILEFAWH